MELPQYMQELIRTAFLCTEVNRMKKESQDKYVFWQPWLDKDESTKQNTTKQLPTTKWKRDRRSRPEYSRKSDPKIPENFCAEQQPNPEVLSNGQQFSNGVCQSFSNNNQQLSNGGASSVLDTPLDMTVRQRGLPPSYSQTINNPGYRSSYRPSVITQSSLSPQNEFPSGMSMCDPIIDEHFRRSLGKDYVMLFSNNNISKDPAPVKTPPKVGSGVRELMDSTGLSVDDHFAKALGDTWLKLNQKDNEIKNNTSENQTVVSI